MRPDPLILRCQAGEWDAIVEWVESYHGRIYNFVYRLLRHREEAEEATQEVIIRILGSLSSYCPESSFRSWIFRIASNYCMDILRKRRQKVVPLFSKTNNDSEGEVLETSDASKEPDNLFKDLELQKRLVRAIDNLPPKYRLVMLLRHQEGLSYQEIVEITDLPVGTVKAQIARARRLLREELNMGSPNVG